MASIEQSKIITIDDYEAYPDDERIEVFEGVPYAMASPSLIHQRLSMELSCRICVYYPCSIFYI